MMKKSKQDCFLRIFIICSLLLGLSLQFTSISFAATKVRLGYFGGDSIFKSAQSPGSKEQNGYAFEYMDKLASYFGWTYDYIEAEEHRQQELLAEDKVDILLAVPKTRNNDRRMLISSSPMISGMYNLYVTKKQTRLKAEDIGSFKEATIGVAMGSHQAAVLDNWSRNNALNCKIIEYVSRESMFREVETGKIDAIMELDFLNPPRLIRLLTLGKSDLYLGISKKHPELWVQVDNAQSKLYREFPFYNGELRAKYFTPRYTLSDFIGEHLPAFVLAVIAIIVGLATFYWFGRMKTRSQERESELAKITELEERMEKELALRASLLQEQSRTMNKLNEGIVELLGDVVESRDENSGAHIQRVKGFTHILGMQVMKDCPEYKLTESAVNLMTFASALHDVGKVAVSDTILLKPGKLTPEEFEIMKTHCRKGVAMLDKAPEDWKRIYYKVCRDICLYHHEKWDGKGYPEGLVGDAIPIEAQIVSVADCFDALTSSRPYKKAFSCDEAFNMIMEGQCGAFSPKLLQCFTSCKAAIFNEFANATELNSISGSNVGNENVDSLRGIKLLLVDDSELNRNMTYDILLEVGADVTTAADGHEAVELFADTGGKAFDAIIMDLVMPGMNGIEATKAIRALNTSRANTIPIIAYTAAENEEEYSQCLAAGMNGRVLKPLNLRNFTVTLMNCMHDEAEKLHSQLLNAQQQANKDALTGVKNANAYKEKMQELDGLLSAGEAPPFAIAFFDVNNLKQANDTYGHGVGNIYIKNTCRIICLTFKHSPVYRIGGDEFVALLVNEDYQNRENLYAEFLKKIAEAEEINDIVKGRASAASGIADYDPSTMKTVKEVLEKADSMMYGAKGGKSKLPEPLKNAAEGGWMGIGSFQGKIDK